MGFSSSISRLGYWHRDSARGRITSSLRQNSTLESTEGKTERSHKTESLALSEKLNKVFWGTMGAWGFYNLLDGGLARFLALETFLHGTGPLGYIGISLNGADPSYGGGNTGSSVAIGLTRHVKDSINYFYVFGKPPFNYYGLKIFFESCSFSLFSPTFPRIHAFGSGMANFGYAKSSGISKIARGVFGGLAGFVTPTLKFRFKPGEVSGCLVSCNSQYFSNNTISVPDVESYLNCESSCRFHNDPDYPGVAAYKTAQPIPASHLGITGSLNQGINSGMFNRMKNNPGKVLLGASLLATAVLVARATYRYIKAEPIKKNVLVSGQENSRSQQWKKKVKILAVGAGWVITAIFLDTL